MLTVPYVMMLLKLACLSLPRRHLSLAAGRHLQLINKVSFEPWNKKFPRLDFLFHPPFRLCRRYCESARRTSAPTHKIGYSPPRGWLGRYTIIRLFRRD